MANLKARMIANDILFNNPDILSLDVFTNVQKPLLEEHITFLQKLDNLDTSSDTSSANSSDTYERLLEQRILQMNEFELMREILVNNDLNTPETMKIVKSKINEPQLTALPNVKKDEYDKLLPSKRIILLDVMPVILRDRNCTWKVHFSSSNGNIYLDWSVCEALVNVGINRVDAFKVKTIFGTHKTSMSARNGFKYSATIKNWSIINDERTGEQKCIFKLIPVMFEDVMTSYQIVVRSENCEMNRFKLEEQLTNHTNSIWLTTDLQKVAICYEENRSFANTLFARKLEKI